MRREMAAGAERPIRIVQFVRSFHLGGTEGQVVELLRGLPRRYHIQVAVTQDAGPLLEQVWQLGHICEEFPLKGTVAQSNTFVQIFRMARWLRRKEIDLVHAHDFYTTLLAVPAARLARVPVLVGRLDLAHFHSPAQRQALATCTRAATHVVANADAIRQMVIDEERVPAERVTVIHNGLDLPRFDLRSKQPLHSALPDAKGAPVLVHVANMAHPVKRQEDLLKALALLKAQGRVLHTWLVGDGVRRPQLEEMAGELGVSDCVHFLGHRTDIPAVLARADLGVLCSSSEGLSNAIIEGMAAALPMVVTRVGGSPDLIEDGVRGFVVDPYQPEQLAEAFDRVLANRDAAREMGRKARAFVERELTLDQLCGRHDALYRRVAGID